MRGRKPVDLEALEGVLVRFSQLVSEQRWIKEIDINPLLASPDCLVALDARVVLHDADVTEDKLPKLAIRPYPSEYVSSFTAKDCAELTIRPIRPEDEPMLVKFHKTLSERTVYQRYLQMLGLEQRVSHERLTRICFIDYDRQISLVAECTDAETGEHKILAVGRVQKLQGTDTAEFAIVVSDHFQGRGVGTEILNRLVEVARAEKIAKLHGDVLADNFGMRRLCEKLGFTLEASADEPTVDVELVL